MPNLRNGSKGDSNPGSLGSESGVLPMSYRAPHVMTFSLVCSDKYTQQRGQLISSMVLPFRSAAIDSFIEDYIPGSLVISIVNGLTINMSVNWFLHMGLQM